MLFNLFTGTWEVDCVGEFRLDLLFVPLLCISDTKEFFVHKMIQSVDCRTRWRRFNWNYLVTVKWIRSHQSLLIATCPRPRHRHRSWTSFETILHPISSVTHTCPPFLPCGQRLLWTRGTPQWHCINHGTLSLLIVVVIQAVVVVCSWNATAFPSTSCF